MGMAKVAKQLPCKYKELSLVPRTRVKMSGLVAYDGNSSAGDMRQADLLGFLAGPPSKF